MCWGRRGGIYWFSSQLVSVYLALNWTSMALSHKAEISNGLLVY